MLRRNERLAPEASRPIMDIFGCSGDGGPRRLGLQSDAAARLLKEEEMMAVVIDRADAVKKLKRYMLAFQASQVIDDAALRIAGSPHKRELIAREAEAFAAELSRLGGSPEFIRAAKPTFELILLEKTLVAEAGEGGCA